MLDTFPWAQKMAIIQNYSRYERYNPASGVLKNVWEILGLIFKKMSSWIGTHISRDDNMH